MKKYRLILAAILLLGIGFASVSTTLNIDGDVKVALDSTDFGIRIIKATLDGIDATISEDGQTVTFETTSLSTVGNITTLDFTAINNSELYDAEVCLVCTTGDEKLEYFQMTSTKTPIAAKRTGNGQVGIELTKEKATASADAFVCTLNATPKERTTKGEGLKLYNVLQTEAESGGVALEYTGTHQDSFYGGGTKKIYHYYASDATNAATVKNKNNVIFAGHCWQMIRTTDTGGVKMIYNGEAEGGKCLNTRGTHVGYANTFSLSSFRLEYPKLDLNGNYYYGTDYTYDSTAKTFKVSGTITQATWNATTGPGLVGKYTCASTSSTGTCSTLYYVERYYNETTAYILKLDTNSHYSQFGTVPFNMYYDTLAHVGYMYNTVYPVNIKSNSTSESYLFGNDVTYDGSSYTLVNTKTFKLPSDYNKLNNNHYTCFSKSGNCTKVNYIYHTSFSTSDSKNESTSRYIELTGGKKVEDALEEMLSADNVNSRNSAMKSAAEAWYEKYLKDYTKYLEDTVYCNNRSISELSGWNPNGGSTSNWLQFKEYNLTKDLSCSNVTDKFSTLNEKAKLKYPIGLATSPELNLLGVDDVRSTGQWYASLSPYFFRSPGAVIRKVDTGGALNYDGVFYTSGARFVVSLAPGTTYIEGNGSMEEPYVVELE